MTLNIGFWETLFFIYIGVIFLYNVLRVGRNVSTRQKLRTHTYGEFVLSLFFSGVYQVILAFGGFYDQFRFIQIAIICLFAFGIIVSINRIGRTDTINHVSDSITITIAPVTSFFIAYWGGFFA